MSFLWQPFIKILTDYAAGGVKVTEGHDLWLGVLQVIGKSLIVDEGGMSGLYFRGEKRLT